MAVVHKTDFPVLICGVLTALLGGAVLFGWAFDIAALTRINPDWKPMVPSTAFCFLLSGLMLSNSKISRPVLISILQSVCIGVLLLLVGARMIEILYDLETWRRDAAIGFTGFHQGQRSYVAAHHDRICAVRYCDVADRLQ
jgi:hypothetical protein